MPQKIFISYRREDAGANALGVSQYLEKEFGRKSVFIDVDMRAGAKFPAVLEERLAECKVMLVLIGPEWLAFRDEQGQRRIDLPDDWVRLEIAQALKRDITVIPIRVNNALLPSREKLPEDIRGLLDHQAVSLTLAGFRHEMSGLVRDIRAIPSPRPWRRFSVVAAGTVFLLAALAAFVLVLRPPSIPQPPKTEIKDAVWSSSPGEWVLYGADSQPGVGYYFKPSTRKKFGDRAVITIRSPFKPSDTSSTGPMGAYQDGRAVFDCKTNVFASAETTIYNKVGEIISHLKQAEPDALNMSAAAPVPPGSVLSVAAAIACDESLATSLGDQVKDVKLSFLAGTQTGDGDLFYGPAKKPSESLYQYEVLLVTKLYQDHPLTELFPVRPMLNYAQTYRSSVSAPQFNCTDRKGRAWKTDNFDSQGNLVYLNLAGGPQTFEVKQGTVLSGVLSRVCAAGGTNVAGIYEGTITTSYKKGGQGEQKISITVEQIGSDLNVTYQTGAGGQGKGAGKFEAGKAAAITLQSTTPGCAGSYEASFNFTDDTITLSFKGEDCGGSMEGNATAKRVKA
jgi:hypothetical protein